MGIGEPGRRRAENRDPDNAKDADQKDSKRIVFSVEESEPEILTLVNEHVLKGGARIVRDKN